MLTTNKAVYGTDGSLTELGKLKGSGGITTLTDETPVEVPDHEPMTLTDFISYVVELYGINEGIPIDTNDYGSIPLYTAIKKFSYRPWVKFNITNMTMNTNIKWPETVQDELKNSVVDTVDTVLITFIDNSWHRHFTFYDTWDHFKRIAITNTEMYVIGDANSSNTPSLLFLKAMGTDTDGDYIFKIQAAESALQGISAECSISLKYK